MTVHDAVIAHHGKATNGDISGGAGHLLACACAGLLGTTRNTKAVGYRQGRNTLEGLKVAMIGKMGRDFRRGCSKGEDG